MIRLALPKGRNLEVALAALAASGLDVSTLEPTRLRQTLPGSGLEVLLLKDWDLPLYVEHGIADAGVVGTDVLEELQAKLLVPLRLSEGRCRFSLIAESAALPAAGSQIRVATKYPNWARRLLADRPWGAEVFRLHGSVELGPLLDLAEIAADIVQTGRTIREHGLHELEVLAEVAPCVVVNHAAYQRKRSELNQLLTGLERAEVVG